MLSWKLFLSFVSETNIRGSDEDVFVSGQVSDLNLQLIAEQRLRVGLEERLRSMEAQLHGGGVGGGVTTTTVTAASLPGGGQTIINRVPVRLFDLYVVLKKLF